MHRALTVSFRVRASPHLKTQWSDRADVIGRGSKFASDSVLECLAAALNQSICAATVPTQIFRGYQRLEPGFDKALSAVLLASIPRFLYPVECLACERPRP